MKSKASDPSALHVVLLQEVERYNSLLVRLRSSCSQVQAGLKGLVVMSADLDEIADALFNAKVALCSVTWHHVCCRTAWLSVSLFALLIAQSHCVTEHACQHWHALCCRHSAL